MAELDEGFTRSFTLARVALVASSLSSMACAAPPGATEDELSKVSALESDAAEHPDEPIATATPVSSRIIDPVEGATPMVALFVASRSRVCPDGWREAEWARGRLLMATTNPERVGVGVGAAFRPADGMLHRHRWSRSAEFSNKTLRLTKGDSPTLPQSAGGEQAYGWSGVAETGLPFAQFLVCERDSASPEDPFVDAMPMDTVALFRSKTCPRADADHRLRWEPYGPADGRFIVPLVEAGTHGRTNAAESWRLGPKPAHDHGTVEQTIKVAALTGDGDECHPWDPNRFDGPYLEVEIPVRLEFYPAHRRKHDGSDEPADVDVPYVELLACKKSGTARRNDQPTPRGFTYFLAGASCATDYIVPASGGRFLVGLPDQAEPNQVYGGPPLNSQEQRTHQHPAELIALDLDVLRRGVGNGTTSYGIASVNAVSAQVASNASGPQLPYIQLAHCWPTLPTAARELFGI